MNKLILLAALLLPTAVCASIPEVDEFTIRKSVEVIDTDVVYNFYFESKTVFLPTSWIEITHYFEEHAEIICTSSLYKETELFPYIDNLVINYHGVDVNGDVSTVIFNCSVYWDVNHESA